MKIRRDITPIKVKAITENYIGDGDFEITQVSSLVNSNEKCLTFFKGTEIKKVQEINCGALIVSDGLRDSLEGKDFKSSAIIFATNPMGLFAKFVNERFSNVFSDEINSNLKENISKFAYIESGAEVDESCTIYPYASIYQNCTIGKNCVVQSSTVVGGVGMSYVQDKNGAYTRLTHLGNVIIEDNVEIGCNTTVLLGILESTIIKKGAKIGNHVNIGHNSVIGENTYISAGVVVGGATIVGKNCWIAPGVSIRDNIKIGDNCTIGVGSVVVKDTEPDSIYIGNPARLYKKK